MPSGTTEPGGLNSLCEVIAFINQYLEQGTQDQAHRAESQLREAIYERRYDPGKKLFSEFVDEAFLPWSRANKRSHREDEQRSVTLKAFFGENYLRDIKPMMIETFKRERLATPTKHDKEDPTQAANSG